jgi:hypothetical protein
MPYVEEVLRSQWEATQGQGQYVFTNTDGGPLRCDNMRNRIWNPALQRARLRHRRPPLKQLRVTPLDVTPCFL